MASEAQKEASSVTAPVVVRGNAGYLNPKRIRKSLTQLLSVCMMFVSGYMMYQSAGVIANSASPAVVVLSGSMEPAFQRGDILFLWNNERNVNIGDVVVYDTGSRTIPIVHRVVHEHHNANKQLLLTKGDNNERNDIGLYENGRIYLDRQRDITGGVVKGYVPKLGYITILLAENPKFKILFLGGMLLLHLMSGD
ncbi:signal peptidase complex catalytic subunit [Starmerella bacillaris]|uniref:Signal peptidase complex catalytic subunit SEC11 n=1 Tax=Starmerella bacillaris TaxID=1247836 RepID=A0AAV5RLK7_STABA|nr:signal peptidase complex catalytic subunit [Starmerella bacillaris]